jgi:arsenical pump membrane protein
MQPIAALSSMAIALGLVLTRPRLSNGFRIGPAEAALVGVFLMLLTGAVTFGDMEDAVQGLWQPLLTVAAIMALAGAAKQLGVLERLAAEVLPHARSSSTRLFTLIFVLSAATSGVLNNDAAVLLLTPVVVIVVRQLYADDAAPMLPFVFAVFMAAGVAPLVVSNPMNMIVADYGDIGFNSYAARMLPISVAGWIVSYTALRLVFSRQLASAPAPRSLREARAPWTIGQRLALALFLGVLAAYPVVSYLGGPIWIVAVTGAALATALCARFGGQAPTTFLRSGVSWETLGFLLGAFIMSLGLRNAGVVDWLSSLYEHSDLGMVGATSAVGSALINNHPMALINLLALETSAGVSESHLLAALIGGDLGPRLLPIGSLAGLLWLGALRSYNVDVKLKTFFLVGMAVTIPSLAVSLLILSLT